MKRRGNSASGLTSNEQAWLRGDSKCGFLKFLRNGRLEDLWERYGDKETVHWRPGMFLPEPRAQVTD